MNKRGISAVVATVLMILLTIVAIGIIWLSMVKIVDSEFEDPTARVEIVTSEGYTFYDKANKTICVQVTRSSSDLDLKKVRIIFTFDDGNSFSMIVEAPGVNGRKTYCFGTKLIGGTPISIKVAPVFTDGRNEVDGPITSELNNIPEGTLGGLPVIGDITFEGGSAICGNNIIEFPETCDDGNTIGWDGCSALCQLEIGGLVGYWAFNDAGGIIVKDFSVNNNDGILNSTVASAGSIPTWTVGHVSGGIFLDGNNDYISIGDDNVFDLTTEITISAWVKPAAKGQVFSSRILSKANDALDNDVYTLGISNGVYNPFMRIMIGGTPTNLLAANPLPIGVWSYVVGTYDGTTMSLYINGALDNSIPKTGLIETSGVDIHIGDRAGGAPSRRYEGDLDEVRIYDSALSSADITSIYNSVLICGDGTLDIDEECDDGGTTPGDGCSTTCKIEPTGLIGHWTLDEGSGITAADSSIYSNDGFLFNLPIWTTGNIDGGLSFDGSDKYVEIYNSYTLDIYNEITISAWVYPVANAPIGGSRILSKSNNAGGDDVYTLAINGNVFPNVPFFRIITSTSTDLLATGTIPLNTWTHIAGTYDGSDMKIYINGIENNTLPKSGQIATSSVQVHLGDRKNGGANRRFNGTIDDVRIYGNALSQVEIQAIM